MARIAFIKRAVNDVCIQLGPALITRANRIPNAILRYCVDLSPKWALEERRYESSYG